MTNDPMGTRGGTGRTSSTGRVTTLAALALAVMAATATAQVQRIDMGRGMDANPQVGTGGSNRPIQGYVPLNGNEIITGNVSGLKYFHAPTGTTSPYEFRGSLGSATLNNFARQSAGGNASGSALGESYYLPSRSVSTGQGGFYAAPTGGGLDSQFVPRAVINPTVGAPRTSPLTTPAYSLDREPQATPLLPGTPGAVLSSPLFTMRSLEVSQQPSAGESGPGILRVQGTVQNGGTPQEGSRPLNQGSGSTGPGNRTQAPGQENTGLGGPDQRIQGQSDAVLNARIGPRETPREDQRLSPVYRDLLAELRRSEQEAQARGGVATTNEPGQGVGQVPGAVAPPEPGRVPGQVAGDVRGQAGRGNAARGQGWNLTVDQERDPLTGMPRPGTARGRSATTRPARSGDAFTARNLEDLPTSTLTAGGRVRELPSLVQARPNNAPGTTMDMLLARAEAQLKEGRYLDAATTYEQSLLVEPENALALVGKAHAELGAGAYQSAAYDLKFVFTRNPQMVGVRYNMATFISPQRQDYLIRDLSTMTANKELTNTSSFLLCYLYYQTGRMQQLRTEIQRWGNSETRDSWQPVLRRAWTIEEPAKPAERAPGG